MSKSNKKKPQSQTNGGTKAKKRMSGTKTSSSKAKRSQGTTFSLSNKNNNNPFNVNVSKMKKKKKKSDKSSSSDNHNKISSKVKQVVSAALFKKSGNKKSQPKPKPKLVSNFPTGKLANLKLSKTAWYPQEDREANINNDDDDDNNPSIMNRLDVELKWFHQYCTLQPIEIEARQFIIENIQTICGNLFGEYAKCVNYGSFATAPICTFSR